MYCTKCGKEIENMWEKCPYCGMDLKSNLNEFAEKTEVLKQNKKKKGKWLWVIGIVIIAIIVICLFSGDGSQNSAALELVQTSAYDDYDTVTIKEVFEFNWENGIWDSFEAEDGTQIVEYAKDKDRNTLIQYTVDLEKGNAIMSYMKIDGTTIDEDAAYDILGEMYYQYFTEKLPLNEVDMLQYAGEDIQKLLNSCPGFAEVDEDMGVYADVSGKNIVAELEGKVSVITLEGSADYSPIFGGIAIGDNINNIDSKLIEEAGYTYISLTEEAGLIVYGNAETGEGVGFGYDETGIINLISWMNNLLETMEISAEVDENVLIASAKDENDLTGTYVDEELGEKIVIIQEDNLVTYKYCGLDDTSPIIETDCTVESDYINGQYYYISKNMDGTLALSSGVGGSWGNFAKVDNEAIIELEETGDVGLSYNFGIDVENGLLYSDENGNITDKNGNIIPEYSDLTVLENGYVFDGECALEGFFSGAGGKLVYHIY